MNQCFPNKPTVQYLEQLFFKEKLMLILIYNILLNLECFKLNKVNHGEVLILWVFPLTQIKSMYT